MKTDGLNSLKYKLLQAEEKLLYTWFMVEIVEKQVKTEHKNILKH